MNKKVPDEKEAEKKLMPQVLRMLEDYGGKSLEEARKRLFEIGVEDPKARESMKMYANNWNDFIHPSILSLSSDCVSERTTGIADLQTMILLLTAAMDIHDDVMDKSTTKNGKATLYGRYGEDLAILVGDALLMESFVMLYSFRNSMDKDLFDRIVATVKNSLLEVGNAHLMELQLKKRTNIMPEDLINLIEKKAAIFGGIAEIGAIAGKGSLDQIKALKTSAKAFGFLVMIREEFIDMFEPAELSNRLKNEYLPLPMLYAIKDPKVKKLVMLLRRGKITKSSVQELINSVFENQSVIRLKATMESRAAQAISMLEVQFSKKKPSLLLATLVRSALEDL